MKMVRNILASMLFLMVLFAGLVFFVTGTESGLQLAGQLLQSQFGEMLQIGQLRGRLATDVEVEDLRIQIDGDVYRIGHLQLAWSPRALLSAEVRVNRLTAESVTLALAPAATTEDTELSIAIDLPVAVTVKEASIRSLVIEGASEEPLVFEQITLSARAADQHLQIDTLQLITDDYQAGLAGSFGLQAENPVDLQLDWQVETAGEAPFSMNGQATISGLLHAYRLQGESSLSAQDIPSGDWQFTAEGNLDGLAISRLAGETLGGGVEGNGRLDWQQGFAWQLAVAIKEINPGSHWPEWPGRLSTQLSSDGRLLDDDTQLSLQLQQLQGQLRGYPVAGEVQLTLDNNRLELQRLDIRSSDNKLSASGSLDKTWDMTAVANLPDMAALLPGWEGMLALSGSITGAREQPRLDVAINGQQLSGPSLAITAVAGNANVQWSESSRQSLMLKLQDTELAGQVYDQVSVEFSGTKHRHQLDLVAAGKESAIDLQLAGDWLGDYWQGEIRRADWQYPGAGRWSLQQPVSTQLGAEIIRLPEICWQHDSARLCTTAQGNPQQQLAAKAWLSQLSLATLAALHESPLAFTSQMDATLRATLDAGRLSQADLQLSLSAGTISSADSMPLSDTHIREGGLQAQLNEEGLTATARLDLDDNGYLRADLDLPGYQPGVTPWEQQSLEASVRSELHDLPFAKYLVEEIGSYKGDLAVNLRGQGTLGQPRISGTASVTDGTFEIDQLGIQLAAIDLQLQSKADGLVITGNCKSGDGNIQLNGDINVIDIAHWQLDASLQGKDFEIMHLPEGIITVSPDIQAKITPPRVELTGEVHVPYARLRPRDLQRRTGVSSDVVIVDAEQVAEQEERWQVSSNIRLSLGDDVTIDGYGLKGDILGSVILLDKPGQVTTAQGNLSIERGSYEVYGRKLDIHRGQLLFSGGPVDNPGLDFEASRTVGDITAGIRGSGTLRKPELSLYSDPSMADSDIISYIAFGKPQAEIGQGGGNATDAGLLAGGNMLAGILGTRLGLEELGVESGDTLDDAAMVLGTYLSPQLYVRYRTGLYDAINVFEVRYEFSRHWSVRSITSVETSSAEIQFSFER
ncbi:MAG: translocation/assembly module TamB domain-containing protein [Gammaproteobacteria bacterium]|nr:translocation/assembly module TamB domain-containing protein [Gammaproteobacteria bacterium]